MANKYNVGDIVKYAPQWCGPGEEKYVSVIVEVRDHSDDADLGVCRYIIETVNTSLSLHPQECVDEDMIIPVEEAIEPEVFYTGGGIWLSAAYITDTEYVTVEAWDNREREIEECLTFYDHRDEDEDTLFPCQNMLDSRELVKLSAQEYRIWEKLHTALIEQMN